MLKCVSQTKCGVSINRRFFVRIQQFTQSTDQGEIVIEKLDGEDKGITVLGLNRPTNKNALSRSMVNSLSALIPDLASDTNTRVVVIRSLLPGVFCAGADLKERKEMSPGDIGRFVSTLRNLFINIEQLPMPVISALDGHALGGGLELALACDIRTAAQNVKLGLVETRLGIIPGAGGTQRLPRILNPSLAKELIFTARTFDGSFAESVGIVNYAVKQNSDGNAAYQKAMQIAREIAPNGPVGVRMAKKSIDKGLQVDILSGYAIEEACYAQVIPTKDRLEGLKAFEEKRKPNYKGE